MHRTLGYLNRTRFTNRLSKKHSRLIALFPFSPCLAFVQLRNWKPLTLDQISESVETTIGDIFGDIASFITLRIRLFRYVPLPSSVLCPLRHMSVHPHPSQMPYSLSWVHFWGNSVPNSHSTRSSNPSLSSLGKHVECFILLRI